MTQWSPPAFSGRHIVVADEDPKMVDFVIRTLREDGHAVFHAYDVLSATQLAIGLEICDLVIGSNTKVEGADGVELMLYLRNRQPGPTHHLPRQHRTLHPRGRGAPTPGYPDPAGAVYSGGPTGYGPRDV